MLRVGAKFALFLLGLAVLLTLSFHYLVPTAGASGAPQSAQNLSLQQTAQNLSAQQFTQNLSSQQLTQNFSAQQSDQNASVQQFTQQSFSSMPLAGIPSPTPAGVYPIKVTFKSSQQTAYNHAYNTLTTLTKDGDYYGYIESHDTSGSWGEGGTWIWDFGTSKLGTYYASWFAVDNIGGCSGKKTNFQVAWSASADGKTWTPFSTYNSYSFSSYGTYGNAFSPIESKISGMYRYVRLNQWSPGPTYACDGITYVDAVWKLESTVCGNVCSPGAQCSSYGNDCSASSAYTITSATQGSLTCHLCESFVTPTSATSGGLMRTVATLTPAGASPATEVDAYNKANAPWLLTCPLTPPKKPTSSALFYISPFESNKYKNIAGDVCLSNPQPLTTDLDLPVTISWGLNDWAHASVGSLGLSSAGTLSATNLGYSPEFEDTQGTDAISSTASVNSYVFEPIPLVAQKDIWTWSATFANFSKISADAQTVNGVFLYGIPGAARSPVIIQLGSDVNSIVCSPQNSDADIITIGSQDYQCSQMPITLYLQSGSTQKFAWDSVSTGSGIQEAFNSVSSDSGCTIPNTQSGSFTASSGCTITAEYVLQYQLADSVSPSKYGTVTPGGWYDSGDSETITAKANAGYAFSYWAGTYAATTQSITVVMNGPVTEQANFQTISKGGTMKAPTIVANPIAINPGGSAIISSTSITTGTWPYTFTWWSGYSATSTTPKLSVDNGKYCSVSYPDSSQTSSICTFAGQTAVGTYRFALYVTDSSAKPRTVHSAAVNVKVTTFSLTASPTAIDLGDESTITSSAAPAGATSYTFYWQARRGTSGSFSTTLGSTLCGAGGTLQAGQSTQCTFSTTPSTATGTYQFEVVLTSGGTKITSNVASVVVSKTIATVKIKASATSVAPGKTVTLTVSSISGGKAPYAYQWYADYGSGTPKDMATSQLCGSIPATSSKCTFATTASTTPGTYSFQLYVYSQGGSQAKSQVISVTVGIVNSCIYQGTGNCVKGCTPDSAAEGIACTNPANGQAYTCSSGCKICVSCTTTTTILPLPPPSPPIPTNCQYIYDYSETTSLLNAQNVQIPFNEAIQHPPTILPGPLPLPVPGWTSYSYLTKPANILPYFTFNYVMPSTENQLMSQSYDIFSPWNYYTPANSIDPLPIDLLSNFYFNYKSNGESDLAWVPTNSLYIPSLMQSAMSTIDSFINNLLGSNGKEKTAESNSFAGFGLLDPNIQNPISIAETPNDYIIVLNQSGNCDTCDYYLSVFRMVPKGYFNTSGQNYQNLVYTDSGSPQITINGISLNSPTSGSSANGIWGVQELITVQPSPTSTSEGLGDDFQIQISGGNLKNKIVIPQSGNGQAGIVTYTVCQTSDTCLIPGKYTVEADDLTTNENTKITLIIQQSVSEPGTVGPAVQSSTTDLTTGKVNGDIETCTSPSSGVQSCAALTGQNAADAQTLWNNNWQGYWANVIDAQNYTTYLVRSIDLGSNQAYPGNLIGEYVYLAGNSQTNCDSPASSTDRRFGDRCIYAFKPRNISVDSNGDVFITGDAVGECNNYLSNNHYCGGDIGDDKVQDWPGIMEVAAVTGAIPPATSQVTGTTGDWSVTSGISILDEIAVSPDGSWVYATSPNLGTIYRFDGTSPTLIQDEAVDLTFSTMESPGLISSQSEAAGSALNIDYYLQGGGLYGIHFDGGSLPNDKYSLALCSGCSDNNVDLASDFDSDGFHNPIGIEDVGGYVYVLDDWKGDVGYQTGSGWGDCWSFWSCPNQVGGTHFDILLLRVLNASLTDMPINPTMFSDTFSEQNCVSTYSPKADSNTQQVYTPSTCITDYPHAPSLPTVTCQTSAGINCQVVKKGCGCQGSGCRSTGVQEACVAKQTGISTYYESSAGVYSLSNNQEYPPYGWVLSANITSNNPDTYPTVNFCSSPQCTYDTESNNPQKSTRLVCMASEDSSLWGNCNWLPIGPELDAEKSSLADVGFSANVNGTFSALFKKVQICEGWSCGIYGGSNYDDPDYSELLISSLNVANYTKLTDSGSGFSCYTNSNLDVAASPQDGCAYLMGTDSKGNNIDFIDNMEPPVLASLNPFKYNENLGATQITVLPGVTMSTISGACVGATTSTGSHCAPYYTNSGTPQLTISGISSTSPTTGSSATSTWGMQETMVVQPAPKSTTESSSDTFQLTVHTDDQSNPIFGKDIVIKATGLVSYTLCQTAETCLAPGSYTITGEDITTQESPTTTTLTIEDAPLITMPGVQSISMACAGTETPCLSSDLIADEYPEAITVSLYPSDIGHTVSVSIACGSSNGCQSVMPDGSQCYESDSGGPLTTSASQPSLQFSENDLCPNTGGGYYTVTATDQDTGATSTQQLVVQSNSATKPTGGAETLSSTISGYTVVPYEYKYDIKQSWALEPITGTSSCPIPTVPDQTETTNTVFSYALVNGQSNLLKVQVEGSDTYLYDLANNAYYHANLTNSGPNGLDLVLPPQIQYEVQNSKLFGNLWLNATQCKKASLQGTAYIDCEQNSQAVLNATSQFTYTTYSYAQAAGATHPGFKTFGSVGDMEDNFVVYYPAKNPTFSHSGAATTAVDAVQTLMQDGVFGNLDTKDTAGTHDTASWIWNLGADVQGTYLATWYATYNVGGTCTGTGFQIQWYASQSRSGPWTLFDTVQVTSSGIGAEDSLLTSGTQGKYQYIKLTQTVPAGDTACDAITYVDAVWDEANAYGPALAPGGVARPAEPQLPAVAGSLTSYSADIPNSLELSVPTSPIVIFNHDKITAQTLTPDAKSDTVMILFGGSEVASGAGSASYDLYTSPLSCGASSTGGPSTCLLAGTYQVQAQDVDTGLLTPALSLVVYPNLLGFNYAQTASFVAVPIFDIYKQVVYDSPLNAYLNASGYTVDSKATSYQLRGYQQLVYVMNDRFDNYVYVPVEADIANPVSIKMKIDSEPDASNPNMSIVTINGIAGYYSDLNSVFTPLPKMLTNPLTGKNEQQLVYLYYNRDINFAYNEIPSSTTGPPIITTLSPATTSQEDAITALQCAFGYKPAYGQVPFACAQSNPVYTGTNPVTDPSRMNNAGVVTYSPSYNSLGVGSCNPPTQGLLSPEYFMCNVNPNTPFGASLSNVCPNTGALNYCSKLPQFKQVADCLDHEWAQESSGKLQDPQSYCSQQTYGGGQGSYADYLSCAATQTSGTPQFCEETNFATGNGICTSQLGSIPCEAGTKGCDQTVGGIPISDSQGEFNTVITACGSRMDQIVADYYGWPPPEPLPTVQVPLQFSANLINKNCEKSTDTGALNPLCNQFVQDELQSTQNMQSEFDYNYSPTQTVVPVQIGTMELGYGSVSLAAMLAAMATSLLLIFWKGPWLRAPRRKRAGKAYVLIGKNA